MRSFIAVDLSEEIREKMKRIQREFRFLEGNAKFVDASQAHITLKFLGEISEELAAEIQRELASLDAEPLKSHSEAWDSFRRCPCKDCSGVV